MRLLSDRRIVGLVAVGLASLLLVLSFVFQRFDREHLVNSQLPIASQEVLPEKPPKPDFALTDVSSDVLWLARCIYSETKRPYEQELVAWVVRNRVETRYRGKSTFQSVVLDPWQFSAFNRNSRKRGHYMGLTSNSKARGWQTALEIAHNVYHADPDDRPFTIKTRHFYSEISMRGNRQPRWARGHRPVTLDRNIDPRRFRFYAEIS
jgi:hypothetical protein